MLLMVGRYIVKIDDNKPLIAQKSDMINDFLGSEGALDCLLAASSSLEPNKVPVVIALHLKVEELEVSRGDEGDEELEESSNTILD